MSIEMIKLSLKNPRRPLYTGFLALALLTYWLVEIWSEPEQTGLLVTKGELVQTVLANGRVQLPERVEISSKMNGKVASLPVVVGQSVRAGETLLVLESSRERAMLAQAKAGVSHAAARLRKLNELTQTGSVQMLHRAQATMDSANKQYARVNNLAAKGYVGQDQVSESLRNLAIAQSQLANAQFQAKASRGKGSDYALAESALNKARANEQAAREKLDNTVVKADRKSVV